MNAYKLFDQYAHRYDLHTPPEHYQHDHQLVIELACGRGLPCRLLDVGCGTGVLLEKASAAGIDVTGIDAAPRMVEVATRRVPEQEVRVERMQDLAEQERYELIVCLSWSIHYCANEAELRSVLRRMRDALLPSGELLLQVAHGPNMLGDWFEDEETGPTGVERDVVLRCRFLASHDGSHRVYADYVYRCDSKGEEFSERHQLECADAIRIAELLNETGFETVELWDSWRRNALAANASPFIRAKKPKGDV